MPIRLGEGKDAEAVLSIYEAIFDREVNHISTGWVKDVYPTRQTVLTALEKKDLYVLEENGRICAAARINHEQMEAYREINWSCLAEPSKVLVIHTLVVAPGQEGKGYGKQMIQYYETLAGQAGCVTLRLDTNAVNQRARQLYQFLGYREMGIVIGPFNNIPDVRLVCLEKNIG